MIKTVLPKSDAKAGPVRGRTKKNAAFLKQIRKKSKSMYSHRFFIIAFRVDTARLLCILLYLRAQALCVLTLCTFMGFVHRLL